MNLIGLYSVIRVKVYTCLIHFGFKKFGRSSKIKPFVDLIVGKRYIMIGDNTTLGKNIQLTAWDSHNGAVFAPSIRIGSGCQFGGYNHITAINSIIIGNGVLTGKFVTISDNSHGIPGNPNDCVVSPINRIVYSKGPVVIEDNVWIGDKATILPNVRIGRGSIVGANSVVTKDVPPHSIVVGSPAKVVKEIKINN